MRETLTQMLCTYEILIFPRCRSLSTFLCLYTYLYTESPRNARNAIMRAVAD